MHATDSDFASGSHGARGGAELVAALDCKRVLTYDAGRVLVNQCAVRAVGTPLDSTDSVDVDAKEEPRMSADPRVGTADPSSPIMSSASKLKIAASA